MDDGCSPMATCLDLRQVARHLPTTETGCLGHLQLQRDPWRGQLQGAGDLAAAPGAGVVGAGSWEPESFFIRKLLAQNAGFFIDILRSMLWGKSHATDPGEQFTG